MTAAVYRSIQQYPNAVQQKGMVIMRVDAPIYFANVQHIRSRLETFVENARLEPMLCPIKFVILDLSPVPFIDATGVILVFETQKQYHRTSNYSIASGERTSVYRGTRGSRRSASGPNESLKEPSSSCR